MTHPTDPYYPKSVTKQFADAGVQAPAIADETGTADATYDTNEVDMINNLKAKLNSALAALRAAGIIAS